MKIYIASDHAGYKFKKEVLNFVSDLGYEAFDCGPFHASRVDYPDSADKVCKKLFHDKTAKGILICGSGQGMALRANKYSFIRAALCWNEEVAKLSRAHNKSNVLCLGARTVSSSKNLKIVETFLKTEFEGGRHAQRVQKISSARSVDG